MQLDFKILKNIFGKHKAQATNLQSAFLLNGVPYYTNSNGNIYDIALARACIHTIATNCAKLQPKHMKSGELQNSTIQYLLGNRPNPYMSTFDFIYKVSTMLFASNNAFVFCDYDKSGKLAGLYPIAYKNFEMLEAKGYYFAKFRCNNFTFVVPYEELIHLRRHFNEDDFTGSQQSVALEPTLQLNNAVTESIVNGVRTSNKLQGLLKANSLVQDDELKKKKDEFVENYLNISNIGGIAVLDQKFEFQQLKLEPVLIDDKQMQAVSNDLLRYYGVSENLIQSKYSEAEMNAFWNNVIEPFAIQFSQELTNKLLTQNEVKAGGTIILSAERMGFASMDTRVKAIQTLMPLGILSINESRKLMELPDIKDGERHLVSLNFVDLKNANKYQIGENNNEQE